MKMMSRIFLLLSITVLMVGCKLAVIVVEGGEVSSERAGSCLLDQICIIDVTDPSVSYTFTAMPDKGWYFEKWNSGDRFFCGGSTNPTCTLSFRGYEDIKEVADIVASSEVFYLMPIFKPSEITSVDGKIIINDKEWLQPVDFTGYSYNQVSAVCPGGACSGFLPGSPFDLTGYTWASSDDVYALYEAYEHAGRKVLEDFTITTTDRNNLILYVMLSDPPNQDREYDLIHLADVTGSSLYPSLEARAIYADWQIDLSQDCCGMYGVWFWRPLGFLESVTSERGFSAE